MSVISTGESILLFPNYSFFSNLLPFLPLGFKDNLHPSMTTVSDGLAQHSATETTPVSPVADLPRAILNEDTSQGSISVHIVNFPTDPETRCSLAERINEVCLEQKRLWHTGYDGTRSERKLKKQLKLPPEFRHNYRISVAFLVPTAVASSSTDSRVFRIELVLNTLFRPHETSVAKEVVSTVNYVSDDGSLSTCRLANPRSQYTVTDERPLSDEEVELALYECGLELTQLINSILTECQNL